MTLRDTLAKLKHEASQSFSRDAIVDEWQKAVRAFLSKIHEFLAEYRDTIQIDSRTMQIDEEDLRPPYTISNMALRADPAVILIQPIGRMIVGATGRVDLHRQGRGAESQRVIALRRDIPAQPHDSQWMLLIPPRDRSFEVMGTAELRQSTQRIELPFSKEHLETALDRLLQQ